MKYQRYITYLSVLLIVSTELCSSTFLAGAMFYFLMGNYITTQIFPNLIASLFKSITQQSPSLQSDLLSPNQPETNSVEEMLKVGQALGINRRLDRYIKDYWPEPDCLEYPCDNNRQKKKKKSKLSESENDDESEDGGPNKLKVPTAESEEDIGEYVGKVQEDVDDIADEELSEDDPFHFYYIMKDEHKKLKRKRQKLQQSENSNSQESDEFQNNRQPEVKAMPIHSPSLNPSRKILNVPGPRRGFLPIFFRHRVPYPRRYNNY